MPLFGAALAAPKKEQKFKTVSKVSINKFKDFSRPSSDYPVHLKADLFFQESPIFNLEHEI